MPAWQAQWNQQSDPLVAGYFAIQADQPTMLDAWAGKAFSRKHAPFAVEYGRHAGKACRTEFVYIAYWRKSNYLMWWSRARKWWDDPARATDGAGYWREVITMPFDRFETLHSSVVPHGVSVCADRMDGPILEHGYPGAIRDRIPLSQFQSLRAEKSFRTKLEAWRSDDGSRVVVTPPENMCAIRSGQDWSRCSGKQKANYLEQLHPVLLEAMRYLRDNPNESRCYSQRFVNKKNGFWGPTEQSSGLVYFLDVYAFEKWATTHRTHIALSRGYEEMVETLGADDTYLRLWHEVSSLPNEGCEFEYINCHPETGLLRYAE